MKVRVDKCFKAEDGTKFDNSYDSYFHDMKEHPYFHYALRYVGIKSKEEVDNIIELLMELNNNQYVSLNMNYEHNFSYTITFIAEDGLEFNKYFDCYVYENKEKYEDIITFYYELKQNGNACFVVTTELLKRTNEAFHNRINITEPSEIFQLEELISLKKDENN